MSKEDAEQAAMNEFIQEAVEVESEPTEEVTEDTIAESEVIPEVEKPEVSEEVETGDTAKPEVDGVQKRINKITADKWAEKRRADALQAQLDNQQQQAQPTNVPKLEDFDYDDEAYQTALIDYKVNAATNQMAQNNANAALAQEQADTQRKFDESATVFAQDRPDFSETIAQVPNLHPSTLNAIMHSDNAPALAYHLGKNLDQADALTQMSPDAALMELGRINSVISQPKPVKTTSAPKPIDALSQSGAVESDIGDNMPLDQWMKKYNP